MIGYYAGQTFKMDVIHKDQDGNIIPLAPITISSRVARMVGNAREVYDLEIQVINGPQGHFRIYYPADQSRNWSAGVYQMDITYTDTQTQEVTGSPIYLLKVMRGPHVL